MRCGCATCGPRASAGCWKFGGLVVLAWRASHLPDLVRRCGGDDRTSTNGGTGADSETQRWTRSKTFIQRRIAFVFVAPQKTEGMAIAILAALFGDNPNVGALTLPIVSYHTVQMLVAAILVPRVRAHAGALLREPDPTLARPVTALLDDDFEGGHNWRENDGVGAPLLTVRPTQDSCSC